SVFAALELEPRIEYIDMPEAVRDQYQYFTEARMEKLRASGCPLAFHTLEEGIRDYVVNYLRKTDPFL
ncbi:MAG: ADP-L-glycero-D-mannoheptose-6-epimerase, partial [Syntrophales bacterium]|nr:ADP-L-glycero-D-mannoheptose-6-epimerase [Syntrophales bacterium]